MEWITFIRPGDTVVEIGSEKDMIERASHQAGPLGRVVSLEWEGEESSRRLDEVFVSDCLDLLRIRLDGLEEFVLSGAAMLLKDPFRRPRLIHIEIGKRTPLAVLHEWLSRRNYRLTTVTGPRVWLVAESLLP